MKKSKIITFFTLGALAALSFLLFSYSFNKNTDPGKDKEMATLYKAYKKSIKGSPESYRLLEKIRKAEDLSPKSENPDEFARILHEMKIAPGEEVPSYPLNYRYKELRKAQMRSTGARENLNWVERGPSNVAGRVRGIVVDPDDATNNTWYIGSVGGGLWKTTDAGQSWSEMAPELPVLSVSTIVMSKSNPDIMYAGTGESMYSVDVINGNGMLKTTDRGETWDMIPSTIDNPDFQNVSRIIVHPDNPDIVIASTSTGRYRVNFENRSGIYKSTDGGNSWAQVYLETDIGSLGRAKKVLQVIENPDDFDILYATIDEKGIMKSTDMGENWQFINNGITNFSGRFELAISENSPHKLYASAEGTAHSELWISSDAGASWSETHEQGSEPNWLGSQGWYDNTIVVHPNNDNVVYVGGIYLYKITLNGTNRNTEDLSTGPVHVDHHNLVILKDQAGGFRILNANDGGIGLSAADESDWSQPIDGLNTTQFYGVDKMPGGSAYVGGMQDNGTWRSPLNSDETGQWFYQIGGDGYETSWHFDDPLKIIGGSQFNGLGRSLDGGQTYSDATNGLSDIGSGSAPFITKIGKTNKMPDRLFVVGSAGVWRSSNFGASWTPTQIFSPNWSSISSFTDVRVSRANPDVVWAGARMDGSGRINLSTDGGVTFNPAANYTGESMGGISGISTHPVDEATAYVMFSYAGKPKIVRTTDFGNSWHDITGFEGNSVSSNGFPDVAVYDLLVMPHTPETLWAGTEIGLFESVDNGATWHMADNGLINMPIWFMTHVEEEVVIASHGRGIWSVKIPGLSAGEKYKPLISELYQGVDGALTVTAALRSNYDSTNIFINGGKYLSISANSSPVDTTIKYPVASQQTIPVYISSWIDGEEYRSVTKNYSVIQIYPAQNSYATNFDEGEMYFTGNGFQIRDYSGFDSKAIHSNHAYSNGETLIYTLQIPVTVNSSDAYIKYKDVAIIEPGDPGSSFGNSNFWDYVVVEGSLDGSNWIPLEDGYDAGYDNAWLSAYSSGAQGNSTMFREHEINILNTFSPGDIIMIRFRLYADSYVTGWGWAIDDLDIQETSTGIEEEEDFLPESFSLAQNYPNPFNPSTNITFTVPETSRLTIKVYDITGRLVDTIADSKFDAGRYNIKWNAKNFASGVYFCSMKAGSFSQTKKMILLR